jgi:hypothetical protein
MPIQFFLTQDHGLLAQYYELRSRVYRRHYPQLREDFGREEITDHHSHIVVGFEGRVVAGGRITISRPEQPRLLPMEDAGFRLSETVNLHGLRLDTYAEFSRVAVDPDYARGRQASLGLIQKLAHTAAGFGIDLVFSICPEPQVRWNAVNSRKCGVSFRIFPEIAVPNPFGIPMTLCAYAGLLDAYHRPLKLSA